MRMIDAHRRWRDGPLDWRDDPAVIGVMTSLNVKEYWIVDAKLEQAPILKRGRSQWTQKTLGPADVCETKLLPGFKLPCRAIFEAAAAERDE